MKCKKECSSASFVIDYKKEVVKFSNDIFDKKKMGLKEFALTILLIEPVSTEVVAMYIGKLGFDIYNSAGKYQIMFNKKIKNGIKGKIIKNENY